MVRRWLGGVWRWLLSKKLIIAYVPLVRRYRNKVVWDEKWRDQNFKAPWLNRGVSPEIIAAVDDGWLPPGASALDIGCGEGEVAAWMASRGFNSVGVDIAPSAIARARSTFSEIPGCLAYFAVDVCSQSPPDRQYRVLIDRGCFHQIPSADRPDFVHHLLAVSAPDARLLLLCRAYRDGIPMGDETERRTVTKAVEKVFSGGFRIVRSADTYLDPFGGKDRDRAMGGIVFWMERR